MGHKRWVAGLKRLKRHFAIRRLKPFANQSAREAARRVSKGCFLSHVRTHKSHPAPVVSNRLQTSVHITHELLQMPAWNDSVSNRLQTRVDVVSHLMLTTHTVPTLLYTTSGVHPLRYYSSPYGVLPLRQQSDRRCPHSNHGAGSERKS